MASQDTQGDRTPIAKVIGTLTVGLIALGFAPILVRLGSDTPPIALAMLRTIFATLLLAPVWLRRKPEISTEDKPLSDRSTVYLRVLAGLALGLHFIFWISSLYFTSVASGTVLVTIHPVMLILIERIFQKRSFPGTVWAGVIMAFIGSAALGYFDHSIEQNQPNPLLGNSMAFLAAAFFVVYFLIGQKVRQQVSWIGYVFPVYAAAALTCVVVNFTYGDGVEGIPYSGLLFGFLLAFGPQILGHGSMNYAVKFVSPTVLASTILSEPVFASIVAYFLFTEQPPTPSLVAMLLIIVGVLLSWQHKVKRQHSG